MHLVDTDIIVDHLRGETSAVAYVTGAADQIVLSAVTVAELFAGVRDGEERAKLDKFVATFPAYPVTSEIAVDAGLYKRDYCKSHGTGLADGIIAATANAHGLELKTLNTKHYPMFEELKPPYRK